MKIAPTRFGKFLILLAVAAQLASAVTIGASNAGSATLVLTINPKTAGPGAAANPPATP